MKYNKLVRDRIPEIIAEDNREPKTRILSEAEYVTELERKLREECEEVVSFGRAWRCAGSFNSFGKS